MPQKLQRAAIIASISILLAFALVFALLTQFYHSKIHLSDNTDTFLVEPGESVALIAQKLATQRIITHPTYFKILARVKGVSRRIKAGEYQLDRGETVKQLMHKLVQGDVIMREFTIVEGWRFSQIINGLKDNPYVFHDLSGLSDDEIMTRLGKPGQHPEGRFFPETYHFARNTSELDILKEAYNLMVHHLTHEWQHRAKDLPFENPYQALIVASLIEKETAIAVEKADVAGVIVRRLKKHMPLQIDPTVIYGLGEDYDGHLSHKDLLIPHPYNTYRFRGLPPTPIAMPSLSSVVAALHPNGGNTLYYVAKGDGSHIFSATFTQHTAAIKAVKRQQKVKHDKHKFIHHPRRD